jgi:DNA polymerase-3 subunit alpha
MSTSPRFIHLRLHTEYSLLEGAMRIKKLAGLTRAQGMPAVAITDTNNMFAALEASETLAKDGVQPIIGCQIDLDYDPKVRGDKILPAAPIGGLSQSDEAEFSTLSARRRQPASCDLG